jgi:hypothetical protein
MKGIFKYGESADMTGFPASGLDTGTHTNGGCQAAAPAPKLKFYKNTDFVDTMINVLRDLPFSQNQPLVH